MCYGGNRKNVGAISSGFEVIFLKFGFCRILRDERIQRLTCQHRGTYADDCLFERCKARCYIVATCDRDLKRRIRKITGVPIMYISGHRVTVEKMPMALGAPKM